MKVLLVGSGAREHALAWKFKRSDLVDQVLVWPGSAALEAIAERFDGPDTGWHGLAKSAKAQEVDLVVVGPEQPLAEGLADACLSLDLPVWGPSKEVAQLESSKAFAKKTMAAAGIPTATYQLVHSEADCRVQAKKMLTESGGVVIKASGLAGGKGVFVCQNHDDIEQALVHLYGQMAAASESVVLEEVLVGRECSFFVLVHDQVATPLGFAVDFKRLQDGDQGPNTGGMGCYTPVPWLPQDASDRVMQEVVTPLLAELKRQGLRYTGFLYVGLMWNEQGPSVVEFNVRLGDPEAQVLAVSDDRDWATMIAESLGLSPRSGVASNLAGYPGKPAVAVVLAGEGYPFSKQPPVPHRLPPDLFEDRSNQAIFAASLSQDPETGSFLTGKGRVMTVVSAADDFAKARSLTYERIAQLTEGWPNCQYRSDIAARLIQQNHDDRKL